MRGDENRTESHAPPRSLDREFFMGLARAFGGAIFFSLPLLMTMEMWWLGFYMGRLQLALFLLVFLPLLVGLSHYSGFKDTVSWTGDTVDALVAYLVGFVTSAVILAIFGLIGPDTPFGEAVGKIALAAVPASVGASVAVGQLGGDRQAEEERKQEAGYAGTMFLMAAGAVFFAFNVAPTEEMILIAFTMSSWQVAGLGVLSLGLMHAFVYSVEFKGAARTPRGIPWWSVFLRYTVVGYALALVISAYVLWTFGRLDGSPLDYVVTTTIVLGFPASLGAAAARLVL